MKKLLLISILLYSAAALGQNWAGVIDPPRAPDESTGGGWGNSGIAGGIPSRTTICATIAAYSGAATTINNAIGACAANGVVKLGTGTFTLSSGINFNNHSNVTLRGAGANQTFINFSGNVNCFGQTGIICVPTSENNWPGGPTHTATCTGCVQGATSITSSSTTGMAVGTMLFVDQTNDSSDTGNIWICETMNTCSQEGPAGAERSNRAQSQIVVVSNVSGSTVTFSPALYMPNWRSGQTPGLWWGNAHVSGVGIEDISLNATSAGATGGIIFNNAYGSWVKGIRLIDPSRNHVWMQWSARIVVRDSYFFNTQNHASESYGVETYLSSDCLIENNIFQQVTTPFQGNGSSSSCVVGYNFTIDNVYNVAGWMIAGNSLHAAGLDNILFEGNQANAAIWDNIHGTHNFATAFRNWYTGWETTKTSQTNAFQIYNGVRYSNLIGNVLGKAGYHNHYQDLTTTGIMPQTSIYVMGWSGNGGVSSPAGPNDTKVNSTAMYWGNYDVVNNAVRFVSSEVPSGISPYPNSLPASTDLPDSFYLSGRPAWWGTNPFPSIGPDITGGSGPGGFAYDIPSKQCYSNVMGGPADGSGSVLSFNEATCYYSAPPTNPPVNRVNQGIF